MKLTRKGMSEADRNHSGGADFNSCRCTRYNSSRYPFWFCRSRLPAIARPARLAPIGRHLGQSADPGLTGGLPRVMEGLFRRRVNARVSVAGLFWEDLGAVGVGTGGTLVQRSHH